MKSHFIKDTNEQYSIREDGVIISHKFQNDRILKTNVKKQLTINKKTITPQSMLFEYFGYKQCIECNNKFIPISISNYMCKSCQINNIDKTMSLYRVNNVEKLQIKNFKNMTFHKDNITKNYVSTLLNISVCEITDELYELVKKRLQLKREVKQLKSK